MQQGWGSVADRHPTSRPSPRRLYEMRQGAWAQIQTGPQDEAHEYDPYGASVMHAESHGGALPAEPAAAAAAAATAAPAATLVPPGAAS